jgi:hypothetical protein
VGIGELLPGPMNFFPIDPHIRWSGDADSNFIPIHGDDFDRDTTVNDNLLAELSSENKHDLNLHD